MLVSLSVITRGIIVNGFVSACPWGGVGIESIQHSIIPETLKIVPTATMPACELIVITRRIPWSKTDLSHYHAQLDFQKKVIKLNG